MTTINTNTSATIAANALKQNDRLMNTAMERLSTGKRINNAGDDAAGLAVTSRMTTHIDGLNQAARNANDAIGMIQTADGALGEITGILQRMREISVQASSSTYGTTDIAMINTEFTSLRDEVSNIVDYTSWNGSTLLDGTVNGSGAGQLGIDTFSIAYADLLAPLTNSTDAELRFTDSNDNVLIIGAGDVTGANVGQGSSLAEIAAGINA